MVCSACSTKPFLFLTEIFIGVIISGDKICFIITLYRYKNLHTYLNIHSLTD
jgi:hypothetical protein